MKNLKFKTLVLLAIAIVIAATSCTSNRDKPNSTIQPKDRTSGFSSPDGTFVGPRGEYDSAGVPIGIGAYGKRKKHKGNLTIKKDGTIVSDIDVEGVILINANDVTISNFTAERVTQKPGKTGMLLEDGTINGYQKKNDGVQWSDFTLSRMNISGTYDGIKAQGNVVIEDSYIHDLYGFRGKESGAGGYSHNDCIQVSAGKNILIERNWMDNCGLNSAVFIDSDQGEIENVTVQHNYMNGGGITLYVIASRTAKYGVPKKVTISNNVFGDTHEFDFATVGQGVTFTDNVRTNGEKITPRFDEET